jgi:hypothetical protein
VRDVVTGETARAVADAAAAAWAEAATGTPVDRSETLAALAAAAGWAPDPAAVADVAWLIDALEIGGKPPRVVARLALAALTHP